MKNQKFHFVGICGTAMGNVAAAMQQAGFEITGSDANVYDPMKGFLESRDIRLTEGYSADNIPEDVDTIVIGNAISRGNPEAEAVLNSRKLYMSLPEALKNYLLRGKTNLVVTGTHGKTTTSSLLTWILKDSGRDPGWLIGGIPTNLEQGCNFNQSEHVVLEGDEYDTAFFDKRSKFLHYLPSIVIINNIEFDHADIYDSLEQIQLSFRRLVNVIPGNGALFVNGDEQNCLDVVSDAFCPVTTVGLGDENSVQITSIDYQPESSSFTVEGEDYQLPMVGEFNVRNAAMAVCAARQAGVSPNECRAALLKFDGIARRQEVKGVVNGRTIIDDFAHHPTAIDLAIKALRQKFPNQKLWVVFEPRSNTTRRNVFQDQLVDALKSADAVVLPTIPNLDKVPEKERLDVDKLLSNLRSTGCDTSYLTCVDEIVEHLCEKSEEGDVIAVLSNGGFDNIHNLLLERLAAVPAGV